MGRAPELVRTKSTTKQKWWHGWAGGRVRLTVLAPLERAHLEALNPRMCGGLLILLDVDGKTERGIM